MNEASAAAVVPSPVATAARAGKRAEIQPVQILRAAAALSVALLHTADEAGAFAGHHGHMLWPTLARFPWGAGVDVFFVISGFVMVYASESLFTAPDGMRRFLSRRVARIVPLYWIMTAATLLVALVLPADLSERPGPAYALASFLFIPWRRPDGFVQPVLRLGWTLQYEMMFYLLFAAFLWLPRRRALVGVIGTIVLAVVLGQILHPRWVPLAFWTDPIILEFAAGVALGWLRQSGLRLSDAARAVLAVGGVVLLAASGTQTATFFPMHGVPATMLVAAACLGAPGIGRSAVARVGLLLGDASYALYLVHPFAMRSVRLAWARLHFGAPALYVVCSLVVACLAAVVLHLWIERPATRIARRLLGA